MKSEFNCPLCETTKKCKKEVTDSNGFKRFYCEEYHAYYYVSESIINLSNDIKE